MRYRIVAGVLAVLLGGCGSPSDSAKQGDPAAADTVRVTGELRSARSSYFGPPPIPDKWNYTIAFLAPDGEPVAENTVILGFDTQELMTRLRDKSNMLNENQTHLEQYRIYADEILANLRLAVEESRADLEKARLKADIPEELLASRDFRVNQLILQQAELEYGQRQAELSQEEIIQSTEIQILERELHALTREVEQLQRSIDSLTVRAPNDGVVIHSVVRRQNKLAVGDTLWMGRRVLEFPDLSQLQAYLEIPEREWAKVKQGQSVEFILDAIPDRRFHGEIVELASVIRNRSLNQPEKVFDATVLMSDADPELMRPGMSVKAEIFVQPVVNQR